MSDNKKGANPKLGGLTAREQELAALVFQCFEGGLPKIDYEKLAKVANFKNAASASACWLPAKKKLMALGEAATANNNKGDGENGDDAGAASSVPATPKTKTPRKRKTKDAENGEDGTPTPKKARGKKAAAKAAPAPAPVEDNHEVDGEEVDEKKGNFDDMLDYEQPNQGNAI